MSANDRSELAGYGALVSELRTTAPIASEQLRERVLALAPGRVSRRRRLVLVVVPLAAALAVGAALVHGFVSSGSHKHSLEPTLGVAGKPLTQQLSGANTVKQKKAFSPHRPATTTAAAGSVFSQSRNDALAIPKHRLVHADASLEVRVPNRSALSHATNKASQIVGSLGGYAQSVRYQSSEHGYGDALLALRVPVQKAQVAIARLGGLGKLLSQQVSTKDLQQQLTRQTNGIGSLRRSIAVYMQALQNPSLPASQRVTLQIRLANARHAITQLRRARTGTLQSGASADISLVLTTRQHAVVVTPHRSGRLGRLLGSAGNFLALEGIIVLYALIVLAPLLVLGGLAWWLLRERRRREERLLASA